MVVTAGRGDVVHESSIESLRALRGHSGVRRESGPAELTSAAVAGYEQSYSDSGGASTPPRHRYAWMSGDGKAHDITPSSQSSPAHTPMSTPARSSIRSSMDRGGGRVRVSSELDPRASSSTLGGDIYEHVVVVEGRGSSLRSSEEYDEVRSSRESNGLRTNAEALQFLRRELVQETRDRRELEEVLAEKEERWRREVGRSVAVAEDMRLLVMSKQKSCDKALAEAKELRREGSRLRAEGHRLAREAAAAREGEALAVARLKELKGAARAAIRRNDSLTVQLEACRVAMMAGKGAGQGSTGTALREERRRREEAEAEAKALAGEVGGMVELLRACEQSKLEIQAELERERAEGSSGGGGVAADHAWEEVERLRAAAERERGEHAMVVADLRTRIEALNMAVHAVSSKDKASSLSAVAGDASAMAAAAAAKRVVQLECALGEASRRAGRLEAEVDAERQRVRNAEMQLQASREALDLCREEMGGSFLGGDSSYTGDDLLRQRIKRLEDELEDERNAHAKDLAREGVASRGRAGV